MRTIIFSALLFLGACAAATSPTTMQSAAYDVSWEQGKKAACLSDTLTAQFDSLFTEYVTAVEIGLVSGFNDGLQAGCE